MKSKKPKKQQFSELFTIQILSIGPIEREPIGAYICRLMMAYEQSAIGRNNSRNGKALELTMHAALIEYGVDPGRISSHCHVDKTKRVEVDILIRGAPPHTRTVAIMCKNSLRERWKQEDRDAMALRYFSDFLLFDKMDPIVWFITNKEKPKYTLENQLTYLSRLKSSFISHNCELVTIYDAVAMDRLLVQCLKSS